MYKDVWKKFGAKIFIVLCSILLVGGVAIAAPRLRAADAISLNDVTFVEQGQPMPVSGAAIVIEQDQIDQSYRLNGNGTAVSAIPDSLTLHIFDGSGKDTTELLDYGTDYAFDSTTDENNAKVVKDGVEIYIRAIDGSKFLKNDTNARLKIKYNIKRSSLNKESIATNNGGAGSYDNLTLVADGNDPITVGKINVNVRYGGNVFPLPASEYDIFDSNGGSIGTTKDPVPGQLGQYTVFIKYKNFYLGDDESADSEPFTLVVKKDCSRFTVRAYSDTAGTIPYEPTNANVNPKKVEILDGTTDVTSSFDVDFSIETAPDGKIKKRLTATPNNLPTVYYVGNVVHEWDVNESLLELSFRNGRINVQTYENATEYKPAGTYKINKQPLSVKLGNAQRSLPVNMYEVTNWAFVVSEQDHTVVDGATAGTVRMEIKTSQNFEDAPGQTGYLYYGVRRSLKDALFRDVEGAEGDVLEYNGRTHYRTPYIYFEGAPDGKEYKLLKDKDYTVTYSLNKRGAGIWTEQDHGNRVVTDAGKVSMTVTGNAEGREDLSGYYGVITGDNLREGLAYTIEAKSIANYKVVHENNTYQLSETEPDLAQNVSLEPDSGGGALYLEDLNKNGESDYYIEFFKKRGLQRV